MVSSGGSLRTIAAANFRSVEVSIAQQKRVQSESNLTFSLTNIYNAESQLVHTKHATDCLLTEAKTCHGDF